MDAITRAAIVYATLLVLFRVVGKRSLAETTTFDVVLLLIISESIQQALVDDDNSMTNALLLVITLLGLDVGLSLLNGRWTLFDKLVDDVPLILIDDGTVMTARLRKARIDLADIMQQARQTQGLERIEQIKYAVLERSGGITIIPRAPS